MKTSSKILGITLLGITALLSIGIIASRIYLNSVMGSDYKERANLVLEEDETVSFDLKDFSSLDFIGAWDVEILQGSEYRVDVRGPGNLLDELEIHQSGNHLTIENNYKGGFGTETFSISIAMPDLDSITIAGGADLSFDGFKGSILSVTLSGAGRVRAFNSEYSELNVICSGAGQLDFKDLSSRNAEVRLSGAGEVILNMNGGELKGALSGMGSIKYGGTVSNESIRVSGLGEVTPR